MTEFSKLVRKARAKRDITQIELARKMGYKSSQYVSDVERSKARPSLKYAAAISTRLKINPAEVKRTLIIDYKRALNACL